MGTFTYRGHRGLNRLLFTGKVRGHRLAPGRYTIRPVRIRGARRSEHPAIGVAVGKKGSVPARVNDACPPAKESSDSGAASGTSGSATAPGGQTKANESSERDRGVRGVFKRPRLPLAVHGAGLPLVLGIVALAVLLLSAVALLAMATNFVRRLRY